MSLLDKVYDSAYSPGPITRVCAFLVGGYVGLVVVAVVYRKVNERTS